LEKEAAKLVEYFRREGVDYLLFSHEPVHTSEQASKARGVPLKTGVKALLLKDDAGRFVLADLAADRRVDLKKLQTLARTGRLHFATRAEVLGLTNCEPGSVHPLGNLFGIPTYFDRSVLENEFVNFNIGELTQSARIRSADLARLLRIEPGDFAL